MEATTTLTDVVIAVSTAIIAFFAIFAIFQVRSAARSRRAQMLHDLRIEWWTLSNAHRILKDMTPDQLLELAERVTPADEADEADEAEKARRLADERTWVEVKKVLDFLEYIGYLAKRRDISVKTVIALWGSHIVRNYKTWQPTIKYLQDKVSKTSGEWTVGLAKKTFKKRKLDLPGDT